MGRLAAANVSRHTVTAWPEPTRAELDARIYDVIWQHRSLPTRTQFPVLALDLAHAQAVGERQIEQMFGVGALGDAVFVAALAREWDAEAIALQMQVESFAAREERRALWAPRQAVSA